MRVMSYFVAETCGGRARSGTATDDGARHMMSSELRCKDPVRDDTVQFYKPCPIFGLFRISRHFQNSRPIWKLIQPLLRLSCRCKRYPGRKWLEDRQVLTSI